MKDETSMKQQTVTAAQDSLEKTIRLFQKLETQSCDAAVSCAQSSAANADIVQALGHLIIAKGLGTKACNDAPDVTANFGGK